MSDKMREEFESWYGSRHGDRKIKSLEIFWEYDFTSTQCMWQAWQASRAALVVELPEVAWADNLGQECMLLDEVTSMLDKAGVKYE